MTHTCLNITSNHFSHAVSRHKHPKKWLLFSGIPAVKSQLLCLSWLFRLESYTHYVLVALVSMSVSQCVKSQEYSAVELHCGNPKLVWLSQVRIDGTIRNSVALASVAFPGKPLYSLNACLSLANEFKATWRLVIYKGNLIKNFRLMHRVHREALSTPIP